MTSIDVPYIYNDLLEFMLETATPEQILAFSHPKRPKIDLRIYLTVIVRVS